MVTFETLLALLFGAALLSMLARAMRMPYPTLLALGGVGVALVPGLPRLEIPPDLILALFVAPILLDAAHDASLRDMKRYWRPAMSLVLVAVGLMTAAVAFAVRWFLPDMPWAAAIALGALVAPPDAVAALAVMKQVTPPHRIRTVLETESLLNDASSLLIYKVAVAAVVTGSFVLSDAVLPLLMVFFGSVIAGWILARLVVSFVARITDAPTATVVQFVTTFSVWLLAERLGLSGVVTIVVFGLTAARRASSMDAVHVRVTSFATWETLTFVLNVLAFTLIGLQLRPILDGLAHSQRVEWLLVAGVVLVVVVIVRPAWVLTHALVARMLMKVRHEKPRASSPTVKSALAVGWAGMRGIVSRELDQIQDPAADRLKLQYQSALSSLRDRDGPRASPDNRLRQRVVPFARLALTRLRATGEIGDEAYRRVEQELDWVELGTRW